MSLKSQNKSSIIQTINEIIQSRQDNAHIENMFFHLRFEKHVSPLIKDIGHFVAHNPRKCGNIFDEAMHFARNLLVFAEQGGNLGGHPLMATQKDLTNQLIDKRLLYELKHHKYELMKSVIEILNESTFEVNSSKIIKVRLSHKTISGISKLFIEIYPVQTGPTTSISSNPASMRFGPNTIIGAEILKAIPAGSNEREQTSVTISQGKTNI